MSVEGVMLLGYEETSNWVYLIVVVMMVQEVSVLETRRVNFFKQRKRLGAKGLEGREVVFFLQTHLGRRSRSGFGGVKCHDLM